MGKGLFLVLRRLAADPRVQAAAIAAFNQAKPHLAAAGRNAYRVAREVSPVRDPAGFARRLRADLFRRKPSEPAA